MNRTDGIRFCTARMSCTPAASSWSPEIAVIAAAVFCRSSLTFCAVTVMTSSAAPALAASSAAAASGNNCRATAARSSIEREFLYILHSQTPARRSLAARIVGLWAATDWRGRRDSIPRPSGSKPDALSN